MEFIYHLVPGIPLSGLSCREFRTDFRRRTSRKSKTFGHKRSVRCRANRNSTGIPIHNHVRSGVNQPQHGIEIMNGFLFADMNHRSIHIRIIAPLFPLLLALAGLASAQAVWFEPNIGQVKGQTQWVGHSKGAYLYITCDEVVYTNQTNVHMRMVGGSKPAQIEGLEPTGGFSNYFAGRDEKSWFTGIPHYARLRCRDVYPGIDLVYYGSNRNAEYDFVVKPGADPSRIELAISQPVEVDHGDLVVAGLRQHRPRVFQDETEIPASYAVDSSGHVEFALATYDRTREVTIDPVLEFSTYLGGPGDDGAAAIALDSAGNIFVAISTQSPAAPTLNPFQQTNIVSLAPAVLKFAPDGKRLLYFSVIGSGGWDGPYGMAVDANGSAILTGTTESAYFPLKNAAQTTITGGIWTPFMTKLSPDGRSLVYSTYYGGSGLIDTASSVAVDGQGNAFFAGDTVSHDFPTRNAIQPQFGGGANDCFLVKMGPNGDIRFSTYYGGSGGEYCHAVAVTVDGVVMAGSSNSPDFPFKNAYQTEMTPRNGFRTPTLVKFSSDGQAVLFASYFGGLAAGDTYAMTTDAVGNVYVAGAADFSFQVRNAYQSIALSSDTAFLAKFDAGMQNLIYATYLGGTGQSQAEAIAVDSNGSAYVAGYTTSDGFPTKNSLQPFKGGGGANADMFISKFDPSGSTLLYSTFLGGSDADFAKGLALDSQGNAYVAGWTRSVDFPVVNAFQTVYGGATDGALLKITDTSVVSSSPVSVSPGRVAFQYVQGGNLPSAQTIVVSGPSFTPSTSDPWLGAVGGASTLSISVSPTGLSPGTYNGTVRLLPEAGSPAIVDVSLLVLAPGAVITSLTPSAIPVGSDDTVVTVNGSGFTAASTLVFGGTTWSASPVNFAAASTLTFTVPAGYLLDANVYSIAVQNPQSTLSNVVPLSVGAAAPLFTADSVVNAASFAGGPVAPGEIITVFGTNLGGDVTFDNIPATVLYSSPTQLSATVPYSVAGPQTSLRIGLSIAVSLPLAASAPGIFTAFANGDGTLTLYATGCGLLTEDDAQQCRLPVSATVNGDPAQVLSSGAAPNMPQGTNQINMMLPSDVVTGSIVVVVTVGAVSSSSFEFYLP